MLSAIKKAENTIKKSEGMIKKAGVAAGGLMIYAAYEANEVYGVAGEMVKLLRDPYFDVTPWYC